MARSEKLLTVGLVTGLALLSAGRAQAIQGCTLKDPDRDVRRLFPEATDYRASFVSLKDRGGKARAAWLAERLGDALDPVYEAVDLPYAYYQVFAGTRSIGWVFGVNQKGRYGGIQIILATDPDGRIRRLYYQRLSTPQRDAFVAEAFTGRFVGLPLPDFYLHDGYRRLGVQRPEDRVGAIPAPADTDVARQDFRATLRGVKKALILFDGFWGGDRHGAVFEKVEARVEGAAAAGGGGR